MEHSESIAELAAALVDFHDAVRNPIADQLAVIPHKTGGQHTYPFADLPNVLDTIRGPLVAAGLSIAQEIIERENGDVGARTWLIHRSGEYMVFPPAWIPGGSDAKEIGAAITYSRRIGILALASLSPSESPDAPATARRRPGASTGQGKARPVSAEPAAPTLPPAIEASAYDALIALANRKGKTADDLLAAAQGKGWTLPLKAIPGFICDWLVKALDKMPDAFDPDTGEQVELSDHDKAIGFPDNDDEALLADLHEGDDGTPDE